MTWASFNLWTVLRKQIKYIRFVLFFQLVIIPLNHEKISLISGKNNLTVEDLAAHLRRL
jgi:hypothetical protein